MSTTTRQFLCAATGAFAIACMLIAPAWAKGDSAKHAKGRDGNGQPAYKDHGHGHAPGPQVKLGPSAQKSSAKRQVSDSTKVSQVSNNVGLAKTAKTEPTTKTGKKLIRWMRRSIKKGTADRHDPHRGPSLFKQLAAKLSAFTNGGRPAKPRAMSPTAKEKQLPASEKPGSERTRGTAVARAGGSSLEVLGISQETGYPMYGQDVTPHEASTLRSFRAAIGAHCMPTIADGKVVASGTLASMVRLFYRGQLARFGDWFQSELLAFEKKGWLSEGAANRCAELLDRPEALVMGIGNKFRFTGVIKDWLHRNGWLGPQPNVGPANAS